MNSTGYSQHDGPAKLRSRTAQVCWALESDWQEYSLSRQLPNKQRKVFVHIEIEGLRCHESYPQGARSVAWELLSRDGVSIRALQSFQAGAPIRKSLGKV